MKSDQTFRIAFKQIQNKIFDDCVKKKENRRKSYRCKI